jgi:hypothetical protein
MKDQNLSLEVHLITFMAIMVSVFVLIQVVRAIPVSEPIQMIICAPIAFFIGAKGRGFVQRLISSSESEK